MAERAAVKLYLVILVKYLDSLCGPVPTSELAKPAARAASVPGTAPPETEIRPEVVAHPEHTPI